MTDLGSTDLEDNAENPRRVTVDGNTVEQHSIRNQMDVADRKASNASVAGQKRGMILTRLKHGSSQL